MLVKNLEPNLNLENFSLILPSVSVGNTGQLAVDYLIHRMKAVKIYQFWHVGVLPAVGKNPFDENSSSLGLSVEMFSSSAHNLVFVQIRSPILKRYENDFLSELIKFIKTKGIKQVIVLSSLFSQDRIDIQLADRSARYIACPSTSSKLKTTFDSLGWKVLEQYSQAEGTLNVSGAGFSKTVLALCKSSEIDCLILLKFCSDGDNIPDALDLIQFLDSWLCIMAPEDKNYHRIKMPPSWKFLFGVPAPKEIY